MYEVKSSSGNKIEAEVGSNLEVSLKGLDHQPQVEKVGDNSWHVLIGNRSHVVHFVKEDTENHSVVLNVDGIVQTFEVKDENQLLLESMGLASLSKKKLKNLKAPMPGLVVRIAARPGDTVPKGGTLLVLEAMKMENIIKSPEDVVVKSIPVNQGDAVEKNEVLVNFED